MNFSSRENKGKYFGPSKNHQKADQSLKGWFMSTLQIIKKNWAIRRPQDIMAAMQLQRGEI